MSERPTHGDRERKAPHSPASGSPTGRPVVPVVAGPVPAAEIADPHEPASTDGQVIHWGRRRLRQALPKVVARCMSFSASPEFDDALTSAVSRFYGVDVDVATAETDILEDDYERVRFFPWFLWDYPLPPKLGSLVHDEPSFVTVGSRFLEHAELTTFEREVLVALTQSSLAFVELLSADTQSGALVVLDLASQTRLEVYDPSLASELEVGLVALVRLIRFGHSAREGRPADHGVDAAIDAIYAVLPHETRPLVELELERLLSGEREPLTVLKTHAPELLDFAEHVLSTLTEPPAPLNADREPLVLCHTLVPRGREGDVVALLEAPGSPFLRTPQPGENAWLWREDDRVVGLIAERPGRLDAPSSGREPRLLAMASSRERFARLQTWLERAGEPLPAMRAEATLDAAGQGWLASGAPPAWLLDPDVASSTRQALSRWILRWPDQPHPAIGGRTPRHLAREPGGHELVARLIDRARAVAGDEARALEDWLLRTPTGT